jgi:hypothetical protein
MWQVGREFNSFIISRDFASVTPRRAGVPAFFGKTSSIQHINIHWFVKKPHQRRVRGSPPGEIGPEHLRN